MFPAANVSKKCICMVGLRFYRFNKNGFEKWEYKKTEIIKKITPKMGRITNKPKLIEI